MRRTIRSSATYAIALLTVGCGIEIDPSERPTPPIRASIDAPAEAISREELYGATPTENLWSPQYELEAPDLPAGWNGARLAILSDLQLGLWAENDEIAAAAVRAAVETNPDVVLLLGDYIGQGEDVASLERILSPLRGRSAVAVFGDRDIRSDTLAAHLEGVFGRLGIPVLRNGSVPLARHGDTIHIAGLDPDILNDTWNDQKYIVGTVGMRRRTPILLTHYPAMATRAPTHRFPIYVSGNTFCGQVEIPGTPRLSWLRSQIFPNASIPGSDRLFRVQGGTVLVTCGVGYGFIPLRFGAAPEVPILTLVRYAEAAEEADAATLADSVMRHMDVREDASEGGTGN